jgi:hypothetical protein
MLQDVKVVRSNTADSYCCRCQETGEGMHCCETGVWLARELASLLPKLHTAAVAIARLIPRLLS